MNNAFKLLMLALMIVSAVLIVELADNPAGKDGAVDREKIIEKNSLDIFVSKSHNYEDRLVFTYSPKNSDSKVDCYVSYEFREEGNILKSIDKEYYKNISTEHPIVLEFPRKKGSLYELKVNIKDKSGINLYKTNIEINPTTIDNKTSN